MLKRAPLNIRLCFLVILTTCGVQTEPYNVVGSVHPDDSSSIFSTFKVQSDLQSPNNLKETFNVQPRIKFNYGPINPNQWSQYWELYYKTLLHKLQRQAESGIQKIVI